MNRRTFVTLLTGAAGVIPTVGLARLAAQSSPPDLFGLAERKAYQLAGRSTTPLTDGARKGVQLSAAPGEGIAFLPGLQFANGTIACDIRGKDVPQQSFVGLAFHAIDGTASDAVYFRPFNFRAQDPVSRRHAVQYHSTPGNGWQKLRTEHPDEYEKAVNPVPDPNGWFRARIVVASPKVSVYVNDATEPCLVVTQLSDRKRGLVGLWVGNNSSGDFANLTISPA